MKIDETNGPAAAIAAAGEPEQGDAGLPEPMAAAEPADAIHHVGAADPAAIQSEPPFSAARRMHDEAVAQGVANPTITPTVGQIVHYIGGEDDGPFQRGETYAAIITRVWAPDCVNLAVFTDGGGIAARSSQLLAMNWIWPQRV